MNILPGLPGDSCPAGKGQNNILQLAECQGKGFGYGGRR
jgi:hypothetical protein